MTNDGTIIRLRNVYKLPKCKMEPSIDPKTGRLPEHIIELKPEGSTFREAETEKKAKQMNLTPLMANMNVELYDGVTFDLEDIYDRSVWEAIKHSPLIAEERYSKDSTGRYVIDGDASRYGYADWYIERPDREAQSYNSKVQLVHNAQAYLFNDSKDNLYIKARLLGSRMNGLSYDEVLNWLLEQASKKPERIIDLYTGADTRLKIILVTAIDRGVIRNSNGAYTYGNMNIGMTEESVILWMKQAVNAEYVKSIEFETFPDATTSLESKKDTPAKATVKK